MKSWQTYLQVWESLASRRSQDFVKKKKKKESQQSAQNSTSTDNNCSQMVCLVMVLESCTDCGWKQISASNRVPKQCLQNHRRDRNNRGEQTRLPSMTVLLCFLQFYFLRQCYSLGSVFRICICISSKFESQKFK